MDNHLLSRLRAFERSELVKYLNDDVLDIIISYFLDSYHEQLISETMENTYTYIVNDPAVDIIDIADIRVGKELMALNVDELMSKLLSDPMVLKQIIYSLETLTNGISYNGSTNMHQHLNNNMNIFIDIQQSDKTGNLDILIDKLLSIDDYILQLLVVEMIASTSINGSCGHIYIFNARHKFIYIEVDENNDFKLVRNNDVKSSLVNYMDS